MAAVKEGFLEAMQNKGCPSTPVDCTAAAAGEGCPVAARDEDCLMAVAVTEDCPAAVAVTEGFRSSSGR